MGKYGLVGAENRASILRSFAMGIDVRDITAEFGVSSSYIHTLARNNGVRRGDQIDTDRARPKPEIAVSVSEVKRLSAKGLKLTHIAAYLRAPYRAVAEAMEI